MHELVQSRALSQHDGLFPLGSDGDNGKTPLPIGSALESRIRG